MGFWLLTLSQNGLTKSAVWSFDGQSTVPPLGYSLITVLDKNWVLLRDSSSISIYKKETSL